MASKESLKVRANQIKNEVNEGRNTANRVGGLLVDMVESMAEIEELNTAIENVNQKIEEQTQQVTEKFTEYDTKIINHEVTESLSVIL